MVAAGGCAATLFGAGALTFRNDQFSSSTREQILWRAAGIAAATIPLALLLLGSVGQIVQEQPVGLGGILLIVYCIARFVIIFLVFRSFRSMPSQVYVTVNWLEFIPFFH